MKKTKVYLDMDGTIVDLYGQPNWLEAIRSEAPGLFLRARPLMSEKVLLEKFPKEKYEITVLSMTPKDASLEYCEKVIEEKNAWLDKHFPALKKRIYQKYGHNKNIKNSANAILVDDNETIRKSWKGIALNPAQLWCYNYEL